MEVAVDRIKADPTMKTLVACAAGLLALALMLGAGSAGEKGAKAPKYTIKDVMKKAHDEGGLLEKVGEGTASAKEKAQLLELYVALHDNAPPKGDKAKWAKATQAMVDAAKAVADSKDDKDQAPIKALVKLVNCKNCHTEFKAPKK
jgi:hypothetical protein